jgi:putative endopeptidase
MVNGTIPYPSLLPKRSWRLHVYELSPTLTPTTNIRQFSQGRHAAGSIEQMVGDFYASGMDTITIDKRGYEPIKSKIEVINNIPSLMSFVAGEIKLNNSSIMTFGVGPDDKKQQHQYCSRQPNGNRFADRDYYFKSDSSTVAIQNAYKKHT